MRYAFGLSAIGAGALLIYTGFTGVSVVGVLRSVFTGNIPDLPPLLPATDTSIPVGQTPYIGRPGEGSIDGPIPNAANDPDRPMA